MAGRIAKYLAGAASPPKVPEPGNLLRVDESAKIKWPDKLDWSGIDQHQLDAIRYQEDLRAAKARAAATQAAWALPPSPAPTKKLEDYGNAEMVMEMIRRGYAVMKLPEDGGPPEALRDG